jgi:tetratricopeptide (TPR) repeat protein
LTRRAHAICCLLTAAAASTACRGAVSRQEATDLREFALHAFDEGMRFAEEENYNVALDRFTRSTLLSPRPAAYYQQGRMYELLGNPEEAAIAYMTALTRAPDYQEARFALLALDYTDIPDEGQLRSRPDALARFTDMVLDEVDYRRQLSQQRLAELTPEERLERERRVRERMATAAARRLPTAEEVRRLIAALPGAEGRGEGEFLADPDFDVILDTYPFHFERGRRFQRLGQWDNAIAEYELALEADPRGLEARLNLGDVYMEIERPLVARTHYEQAMNQHPESPRPVHKLGVYYDRNSQIDLARQHYLVATQMDPSYMAPYNNLARLEILERNYDAALERLAQALAIDPAYALAHLNVGIVHENRGEREPAIAAYERYVELGGDPGGPAPAEVRRWIAELRG